MRKQQKRFEELQRKSSWSSREVALFVVAEGNAFFCRSIFDSIISAAASLHQCSEYRIVEYLAELESLEMFLLELQEFSPEASSPARVEGAFLCSQSLLSGLAQFVVDLRSKEACFTDTLLHQSLQGIEKTTEINRKFLSENRISSVPSRIPEHLSLKQL